MWKSREGMISVLRKTAFAALSAACIANASTAATIQPSEFPARILAAHNAERARAGMPPLVWDNGLGVGAAVYAQQMAVTGVFQHSNRQARRGIGENLWMGSHAAFSFGDDGRRLGVREALLQARHLPPQQHDRELGRRWSLYADDLAGDDARWLCARLDRTDRLSRLSVCDGGQYRRPAGALQAQFEGDAANTVASLSRTFISPQVQLGLVSVT